MSLNNSDALPAFLVYKKSTKNKVKQKKLDGPPPKKSKVKSNGSAKLSNSVKITNNNNFVKQNGTRNSDKKVNKKKKTENLRHISDEEEPPLLEPIRKSKRKSVVNKEKGNFNKDASISEFLSDLHKTDPSPDSFKLFEWLMAPVTPKKFFESYWERDSLYIGRNNDTYYTQILTTERLDSIFRDFPLYYTRNVDVVSYENGIKEVHNDEGRVAAPALYDYYSNGCSIRVLNPQTYDQKVHLLIATLQEYFGTMVGTNVYLTPPGSQGFAPHYDDIEAFIIQLEGRKHWKLYKPVGADVLARYSSQNLKHEDIGEPALEITLKAGDLLYFPRGTIHEGRTDPGSHSLHITVSVYQHTSYIDLLEHVVPDALKRAATENLEFRQGLPVNYLKHLGYVNADSETRERSSITKKIQQLMQSLINYVDIDQAADKLGRKFMYDSMPPVLSKKEARNTSKLDGDFMKDGKIFNRVEIGMDTEVRLLRYHCLRLVVEEENAKIYYNTDNAKVYHGEEEQFLIINTDLVPCIKKLQNFYPEFILVEDLPGGDDIGKAQLVADLWERGLLVTNGPLPPISDDSEDEDED